MVEPALPETSVLNFRNTRSVMLGQDASSQPLTQQQFPFPTMKGTKSPYPSKLDPRLYNSLRPESESEEEATENPSQDMRKSPRKRQAPTRFEQFPLRKLVKTTKKAPRKRKLSQSQPQKAKSFQQDNNFDADDPFLGEESDENANVAPTSRKNPGRQLGQTLSYGKRLTKEVEII